MVTIFDVGGGAKIRGLWPRYFAEVHGAVFVIDAGDRTRLSEAKTALLEALKDSRLNGKPILIFANKQDLPTALSAADISLQLALHDLKLPRYHIKACVALTRENDNIDPAIKEGLKWIVDAVETDFNALSKRVEMETAAQKELERKEKEERRLRVERMRAERKRQEEEDAALLTAGQQTSRGGGNDHAVSGNGLPLGMGAAGAMQMETSMMNGIVMSNGAMSIKIVDPSEELPEKQKVYGDLPSSLSLPGQTPSSPMAPPLPSTDHMGSERQLESPSPPYPDTTSLIPSPSLRHNILPKLSQSSSLRGLMESAGSPRRDRHPVADAI
eukprot:CAMPEP_0184650536 /NCGR_PEP_ID=MMETSP0308-20130426/8072_1 /TAXON_ID=38269 /ORGANISM="Gloeochaete witrockiana, Strain SAG 46.84" /LENGTH=327 /DNA_ID=CAMNT_0027084127 /DNA_START=245 /DNA_END=1228 /DNA_ORIENTATION=-